jgi:hypothetical protein
MAGTFPLPSPRQRRRIERRIGPGVGGGLSKEVGEGDEVGRRKLDSEAKLLRHFNEKV